MLALYSQTLEVFGLLPLQSTTTYHEVKQRILDYQAAKEKLMRPNGVFAGWVCSGARWERFDLGHGAPHIHVEGLPL